MSSRWDPSGRAGAAVPRPQELDWAYEPLKAEETLLSKKKGINGWWVWNLVMVINGS
jgi:hypothetical protein